MRIIFMGTAELASPCLEALAAMPGHQVVHVVSQPDRPKGRSLQLAPPPVKVTAEKLGLPVSQPLKLRASEAVDALRALQPDLIIVVAYGQILSKAVLEIPSFGCVNVHTSLLPRWRGASPIQSAILAGDAETGVTTMYMDELLDHGDIILQRADLIRPDDTSAILHDRLAQLGAGLLVKTVNLIAEGKASRTVQDESKVTLARKFTKEDGRLDWTRSAEESERQIRAFNPWPGAYTFLGELLLKVWRAEPADGHGGASGEIRGDVVNTGKGGLRLLEVQPAGKKRMDFASFQRGHQSEGGIRLR